MIKWNNTFSQFPALSRLPYDKISVNHRYQVVSTILVHANSNQTPEVQIIGVLLTETIFDVLRCGVSAVEDVGQEDSRAKGLIRYAKGSNGVATDGNGVLKESIRLRGDDSVARDGGTCRLPEDCYVVGIAVEVNDVVMDPLECRLDVPQTVVTGKIRVLLIQYNSKAICFE